MGPAIKSPTTIQKVGENKICRSITKRSGRKGETKIRRSIPKRSSSR
jgi:hypothetical protein